MSKSNLRTLSIYNDSYLIEAYCIDGSTIMSFKELIRFLENCEIATPEEQFTISVHAIEKTATDVIYHPVIKNGQFVEKYEF